MSGEGPGQFLSPDDALDDSWSADDLRSTSAPLLPMQSYSYTSLEAGQSSTVLLARDWMSVQVLIKHSPSHLLAIGAVC